MNTSKSAQQILSTGWISLADAIPPYNKGVLITDGETVSFGRYDIILSQEQGRITSDTKVIYRWKSMEPYLHSPTHWMPLPFIP